MFRLISSREILGVTKRENLKTKGTGHEKREFVCIVNTFKESNFSQLASETISALTKITNNFNNIERVTS